MKQPKMKYLVGDFETTVYEGQTETEVWASALVELYSEDVLIHHSINETLDYLISLNENVCVYYHNLSFDGTFWLSYLLTLPYLKQALKEDNTFYDDKELPNNTYKYVISQFGEWYYIRMNIHNHIIEIRDSLKLLPFSVKRIGQSFGTKHKKLTMEYTGYRYAGCIITDEEKEYIANDVLVVKEALEIMFNEGHKSLTIGSCCLKEYKNIIGKDDFKCFFPNLTEMKLNPDTMGSEDVDAYIRKSYKGGWCYVVHGKENKICHNGVTADVNSLYPSMMSSESGNKYPIGNPQFWLGNKIPKEAIGDDKFFFIRIRTRFKLKVGKLPCIQIKNNLWYNSTEWLERSDIYDRKRDCYYSYYRSKDGEIKPAVVTLTLTEIDYKLICEQYDLYDFEILDGCWFDAEVGLFDRYIDKYKKIKMESKGAKRELAKLFLNNLYGKLASSSDSTFKVARLEDGILKFDNIEAHEKIPIYIPIGSAITSYARNFTIRAAQANYYGKNERGFIYADTDSIHCDLDFDELVNIKIHDVNFCSWKIESYWDEALFVRQKTYIEHITHENMIPIDKPYYSVRCAGLPEKCKQIFIYSTWKLTEEEWEEKHKDIWDSLTEEEKEFVLVPRDIMDFKVGLIIPCKLQKKIIKGGTVLLETSYEMRDKINVQNANTKYYEHSNFNKEHTDD